MNIQSKLLTAAIQEDNAIHLDFLLSDGYNVNTICGDESAKNTGTVLLYALNEKKRGCVDLLLNKYADKINFHAKHQRWGETALHMICEKFDNPGYIEIAIKQGNPVDVGLTGKSNVGLTPFTYACQNKNPQMAITYRDLIRNNHGVYQYDKSDLYEDIRDMFYTACHDGYANLVDALLNEGYDVNGLYGQETGLILACQRNELLVVERILKESNVNLDVINHQGKTALDFAKDLYDNGKKEIYERLIAFQENSVLMKAIVEPNSDNHAGIHF